MYSVQCAAAIDHLASFYFEQIIMGDLPASPALFAFAQHVSDCADVFLEVSLFAIFVCILL